MFIVFEGNNGSGKTTLSKMVEQWFHERGKNPILLKEPGGTLLGEDVRRILLNTTYPIHPLTQLLLFSASRNQLLKEVIKPHLEKSNNNIAILDRYIPSTYVFQGVMGGISRSDITLVNDIVSHDIDPDIMFYLRVDDDTIVRRLESRGDTDRFEDMGIDYHVRANQAYDNYFGARRDNPNIYPIDGNQSIDNMFYDIQLVLESRMGAS